MLKAAIVVAVLATFSCVESPSIEKTDFETETSTVTQAAGGTQNVRVVNAPTEAVPVRVPAGAAPIVVVARDEPARQPFQRSMWCAESANVGCPALTRLEFVVPAGKRLVIEQLSGVVTSSVPAQVDIDVWTYVDGGVVFHYLPSVSSFGTGQQKRWMERTRLYGDPGMVVAVFYRNPPTVFTTLGISLSGYLVNVDPFAP